MTPTPPHRHAVVDELSRRRKDWIAFARSLLARGGPGDADAEEIVQEAFARACRGGASGGEAIQSPTAWFRTIVARCVVDAQRRAAAGRRRCPLLPLGAGDRGDGEEDLQVADSLSPPPCETLERADLARSFLEAAARLSSGQRRLFFLVYGAGVGIDEAARELGLTIPAAHALLFRARTRLRRAFRRYVP